MTPRTRNDGSMKKPRERPTKPEDGPFPLAGRACMPAFQGGSSVRRSSARTFPTARHDLDRDRRLRRLTAVQAILLRELATVEINSDRPRVHQARGHRLPSAALRHAATSRPMSGSVSPPITRSPHPTAGTTSNFVDVAVVVVLGGSIYRGARWGHARRQRRAGARAMRDPGSLRVPGA